MRQKSTTAGSRFHKKIWKWGGTALSLIAAAAWQVGCADAPSTGPTPPDYVSQYRFIHAASDLGDVGVAVDGAAIGTLGFQGAIPHVQFPAGSRVAVLSNGDTLRISMQPERRGSVVILQRIGQARDYINLTERRVFDPTTTSEAWVRIVNVSPEPALDVRVIAGADTAIADSGMVVRDDSGYHRIAVGNYTISLIATGDTTNTVLASAPLTAANKRQTSLIVGSVAGGNLGIVNLSDD
jgi:hypothetical protein